MRPLLYEWNGQSLTMKELSRKTGISVSTLYARLEQNGYSIDKAVSQQMRREFRYGGKRYTAEGLAHALGIAHTTLYRKLKRGMTVDEIALWARETEAKRRQFAKSCLRNSCEEGQCKGESICWHCGRNESGCSWARNLVLVEGCRFVERITLDGPRKTITSCPEYIRSERRLTCAVI